MLLPNPLKTPAFLQKIQWVADPIRYLENAAQQYPDIFTARIVGFGDTVVFVNHPQGIQEIFNNDRKKFAALGKGNKILQPIIGDYSVVMQDGNQHKRRRQLLMPPFHGERMRAYGSLICDITKKVLSQLPLEQPFLAQNVMQDISLQVILQAVFGLYEGERCQQLKHLLPKLFLNVFQSPLNATFLFFTSLQQDLGPWSPWGKFVRLRQQIDELLYAEIAERRQKPNQESIDILSLLMSAQDEAGNPMTDRELRDELMTMMAAGYETTGTAMAWALYWIHHQPEVREQLLEKLDELGDSPDPMSIVQMPYLTAVCNETLRITPLLMVTLPRFVQEPVELLGYSLKPNTIVVGSIYLTHHREDLYPQSKQFKPERFLERQYTPYEFLPFSGGARRCIGEALAMYEMKLAVATILSSYQLSLVDRRPEKLQRRGIAVAPANGVKMVIKGRRVRSKPLATATTPTF